MRESLSTLRDLLTRPEFQTGLVVGAVALTLLAVGPRAPRWGRPWALATATAVLVGLSVVDGRRLGLVAGVGLMAIGGWTVGDQRWTRRELANLGWPIVLLGALLIPWRGQVDQSEWFYVATPLVAVSVGAGFAAWGNDQNRRMLGVLFLITTFGVWTTVPDTELARLQLGVAIPCAFATLPPVSARATSAGAFALGGVFAWLPTLGGELRPASIIGAWTGIGLILLIPLARLIWPARSRLRLDQLFVVHGCVVLIAARVIGLWTWALPAAIAAVALSGGTLLVIRALAAPRPSAEPPPSR